MKIRTFVIVEPDGDGFHAYCPAFRGLHMDGDTVEQAFDRTRDGLVWYLHSLERHGDPLPVGPDCIIEDNVPVIQNIEVSPNATIKPLELQWVPLTDQS